VADQRDRQIGPTKETDRNLSMPQGTNVEIVEKMGIMHEHVKNKLSFV
jgi:hypothetical protein